MLRRHNDEFSAQEIAPALIDGFHKLYSLWKIGLVTLGMWAGTAPPSPVHLSPPPIGEFPKDAAQSSHQNQSRGYIITLHPERG